MALNPKSGQGDGAGFNRLRAAQAMRMNFQALLSSVHDSGVYVDQIREYAGAQIVFFRVNADSFGAEEAHCAVFSPSEHGYVLSSDVIVNQE
jgi:hypothetical protein